ncbi:superoxide dismutase family protein [Salicibibacter cibi]|uniref:Superoxide dismutase [Cu-Zn] n=1 Tax=Salicibibacter cibi TaxID=2743001 RepID=A0A7T7CG98_9BACI|nr:superoxide dismutase family protein [Salicibibacter cibi]QQK80929.1 superoxide dismutase family protein [Salicibibacter cibi]
MKKNIYSFVFVGGLSILLLACSPEGSDEGTESLDTPDNGEAEDTNNEGTDEEAAEESDAVAELHDENEERVGTVSFNERDGDTRITAEAENLEPGFHGFHIHEEGICEPDAEEGPFDTAEGHYAPEDNEHGEHAGDLPPLYVKEDGTADMSIEVDRFTPDELVEEETAMIIHSDPDNFAHIPDRYTSEEQDESGPDEDTLDTGDAGDRVACAVIEAS